MSKCYYVFTIVSPAVVTRITDAGLFQGFDVHKDNLITLGSFAMCETLKEAKEARRRVSGIIVVGERDEY